jgi:serine phosphatase RsbU (regulator of sigma subunit)
VAITTDGYVDQVGGPKRIAFGRRRLAGLLAALRDIPPAAVLGYLRDALLDWQGGEIRRDDVTVLVLPGGPA